MSSKADLNLEIRRNIYDDKGKAISSNDEKNQQINGDTSTANGSDPKTLESAAKASKKAFYCFSCGIDCTKLRFHYAKTTPATAAPGVPDGKYDLCPNCFLQGRLPSTHHASDFVKLEDNPYTRIPDRDAPWSNSELLLLLEGLENFDDNWQQIAHHVGSRTPEECVMRFLQLEIEDKYLEDTDNGAALRSTISDREPVSQLENPVLSVIAYLAQLAEPAVAAAAAGRTVSEVQRILQKQIENGTQGKNIESEKEKEKPKESEGTKAEDSMEIDNQDTTMVRGSRSEDGPPASASTVALATSAARAAVLASHEEREMTRLVSAAVNVTLQKFDLKLAQFTELEQIVEVERRDLENGRQQLLADRIALKRRIKEVQDLFKKASLAGPEAGAAMLAGADRVGLGDRFGLQASPDQTNGVQPYSVEGSADFKSFEL